MKVRTLDILRKIRKPVAPPSKRFKTKKEYDRKQNYLDIDSYPTDEEEVS